MCVHHADYLFYCGMLAFQTEITIPAWKSGISGMEVFTGHMPEDKMDGQPDDKTTSYPLWPGEVGGKILENIKAYLFSFFNWNVPARLSLREDSDFTDKH